MSEEDTTKPTNGEAAVKSNNGKPNRNKQKSDQKPIEELYDLTQPIPRVRKNKKETVAQGPSCTSSFVEVYVNFAH
jgi:hypothetical protein